MITIDTLSKLITAVCAVYSKDPSQPSVTLSRLKEGGYYGSIIRYHKAYGNDRDIVTSVKAETIGEVLRGLGKFILDREDAIRQLREDING